MLALVEVADYFYDLAPALGVEHGGGFVQNYNFGLDGKHARNGYALLLSPRKTRRRGMAVLLHADRLQRPVYSSTYFFPFDAYVFGSESHVVLYNRSNSLIVWILKHNADAGPYVPRAFG